MSAAPDISEASINRLYQTLKRDAEKGGYNLNPDESFTMDLVRGLAINDSRYGYPACPCRLAAGVRGEDIDIICPCFYRDPDLLEYDACYCGLYVSPRVMRGETAVRPIPERRPDDDARRLKKTSDHGAPQASGLTLPVWRCSVCGYLCAREGPPHVCPICKAEQDRFERFM